MNVRKRLESDTATLVIITSLVVSINFAIVYYMLNPFPPTPEKSVFLYDDFSGPAYALSSNEPSPDSKWMSVFGGGAAGNGSFLLQTSPQSRSLSETHSSLIVSTSQWTNFNMTLDIKTVKQQRLHDQPNSWEIGWIFFRYTDLKHYYWFHLRTNGGFEFGKRQCDTCQTSNDILRAQLFMVNVDKPKIFKMNEWQRYSVQAIGNHIMIYVDGNKLVDYIDNGTAVIPPDAPLTPAMSAQLERGSIAMYAEDSIVQYRNIVVRTL